MYWFSNISFYEAKHGVSPYQLAVWQNHLQMVQYLTSSPFVKADPHQVNEFACSAVHWLGTATRARAGENIYQQLCYHMLLYLAEKLVTVHYVLIRSF
jgi:hypothetical protein